MFLFFLGFIILLASFGLAKMPEFLKLIAIIRLVSVIMMGIGFLMASVKQIDAGQVGVQKLFGKVNNETLPSGLHIINPFTEVINIDTRTQNYTMSSVHNEGNIQGDDAIRVLSSDGLEVILDVTVLYSVVPTMAPKIIKEIGEEYTNVIVRPLSRTKIRDNAVYYDAISLFSSKRDEFQARIFKNIETEFKARGMVLEQLLVRNITLPASVKASIESKINAEQDAQKMQFVLKKEQQEAERKRVEAQGIADYHKIISTGLNDKQLQYETIKMQKELATSPNSKLIFMGQGKSSPVIINGN